MPAHELELVLEHDGRAWLAYCNGIKARANSLPELDNALARSLAAAGKFPAGAVTVHMRFNRGSLPGWLRQYTSHYFNRTVRLQSLPSTESAR